MEECTLQPLENYYSPDSVHLCPRGGDVLPLNLVCKHAVLHDILYMTQTKKH